jgi:MFS family permease
MLADIAEGLRFLWHQRVLRTLAVMVGIFNFASNAAWGVLVLYAVGATSAMGLSDPAYGLLLTTVAVGSLIGSLVAERVEQRLGRQRSLALTTVGSALLVGAPALTANPYLIGAAFFLGGSTIAIWNVITVSLRQRITPDRLLGRVNSAYRLLAWGSMPLGAAVGGLLAQLLGLRVVFAATGLLTLALIVVLRGITDEAMDAADVTADA